MPKKQLVFVGDSVACDFKNILKKDSPKKIFLVTGSNSYRTSGAEEFFSNIFNDYNIIHFCDFSENPKIQDVERGISLFIQNSCDYVIAIGGGSVIDMAKLINIGQACDSHFKSVITENKKLNKSGKKLIAIPTTAGAGSEATHFAVVYVDSKKYSLAHSELLLPDCVFLIPRFTYSLNKYQTAVSGIDAFSQAVESYWSVNSNFESKKIAEKAIELILTNLSLAVKSNNTVARDKMLLASYFSGQAINISKTTGAHALSYSLTSYFNIPHGHAVALTLPSWFKLNYSVNNQNISDKRGVNYVLSTMNDLLLLFGKDIESGDKFIQSFIRDIGLETRLSKLNVKVADLKFIIENVNIERLSNNPRACSKNELRKMLDEIY